LTRINVLHFHHQTAWRFGLQLLTAPSATDTGTAGSAAMIDDVVDDDSDDMEWELASAQSDALLSSDDMDISSS
jgi:hypothetical protein